MKILDATAGYKEIWFQKNHPFVTFMDIRNGKIDTKTENTKFKNRRRIEIKPDVVSSWEDAPFPDNYFDMVVFDPPHIFRKNDIDRITSTMEYKYGWLYDDNWKHVLKKGINKLFRVLKPKGIFILKWSECNKKINEILPLFPYPPLFGTRSGKDNTNLWIVFLRYDVNIKLDIN